MATGYQLMLVGVRLANALYRQEITPIQWVEVIAYLYGGQVFRIPEPKELLREMAEIEGFAAYCDRLVQKYVE